MTTTEQVREYIQARLESEKLSSNQFAMKSGISQGGLSMFLRGKRGITLTSLEKLAQGFGLRPWKFLREVEYHKKNSG